MEHVTKAGSSISVQVRRNLLCDESGKPYGVLSINTDVTEVNTIREQLLRTQRLESIGALAGGIAHDLNNMLAPVMMATDILGDEVSSPFGKKALDMMRTSVTRSSEMIRQILTFARGTGGEYTLLDAGDLVGEIGKFVTETFPRKIRILTHIGPDLCKFSGNHTRIHQVLLNLCVNARDAMPNGGTLELSTENCLLKEKRFQTQETPVSGQFVLFRVADSGTGIPAHLLKNIFEPFFTTKGVGKGTGLGLSTVMGIVKAHNGFLEVDSIEGKGTTFNVYLPADQTKVRPNFAGEAHGIENRHVA
jgi:two-component system, cell cycle sensor histidine kinase and response regulator CckA